MGLLDDNVSARIEPTKAHCDRRLLGIDEPLAIRCSLDEGVFSLPIHDVLLVAESHKEIARAAMLEAFRKYAGGFVARIS